MEQLLSAFGIEIELIIAQIINFGILVVVLSYFLYKPLLAMLQTREEKITQGMQDAEDAAKAKAAANEEKKEILSQAHKNAQEVGEKAKEFADQKVVVITKEAQEKAESIIKSAEAKSAEIKEQARKDSEAEIRKLAVLAAEKILQSESASSH